MIEGMKEEIKALNKRLVEMVKMLAMMRSIGRNRGHGGG